MGFGFWNGAGDGIQGPRPIPAPLPSLVIMWSYECELSCTQSFLIVNTPKSMKGCRGTNLSTHCNSLKKFRLSLSAWPPFIGKYWHQDDLYVHFNALSHKTLNINHTCTHDNKVYLDNYSLILWGKRYSPCHPSVVAQAIPLPDPPLHPLRLCWIRVLTLTTHKEITWQY